jgi:hypothetical protein
MNMEGNMPPEIPSVPTFEAENTVSSKESKLTVPFEDKKKDFFSGMFETMKLVLFSPTTFFSNYKFESSIGKSLLFAVLIGWFSTAVALVWSNLFQVSIMKYVQQFVPQNQGVDFNQFMGGSQIGMLVGSIFGFFIAPVAVAIGLFIYTAIYHLFLMIVKGADKGFETTFNVVAYGSATNIFKIVPFAGGLITFFYSIVVYIIGLSNAHNSEGWKGAFAVLAPIVFCCCCFILLAFVFAAGIGGMAQAFN